jgi:hypothetical protein
MVSSRLGRTITSESDWLFAALHWCGALIPDRVIDYVKPTEYSMQQHPPNAVPLGVREHHRCGAAHTDAGRCGARFLAHVDSLLVVRCAPLSVDCSLRLSGERLAHGIRLSLSFHSYRQDQSAAGWLLSRGAGNPCSSRHFRVAASSSASCCSRITSST